MEASNLNIPIILGTGREGRSTEAATQFVYEQAHDFGFTTQIIDVRDYHSEITHKNDNKTEPWEHTLEKADGLIVVSPEYNHGYPGELKMFLDQTYTNYNQKPVAVCGVSSGGLGGARMVEVLKLVFIELQMVPTRNSVYFSQVSDLFNEQGQIEEEHAASYTKRLKKQFTELAWYAEHLKHARKNSPLVYPS